MLGKKTGRREEQYDILRVICCCMIILLHCGSGYTPDKIGVPVPGYYFQVGEFFATISRAAVPCFVMLSGRFLLEDDKNRKYGEFYRKSFWKLGIPTIIFSLIYTVYAYLQIALAGMMGVDAVGKSWLDPLLDLISGKPHVMMWYMFMLTGLYALVPFLVRLKSELNEKQFLRLSAGMLLFGILVQKTCELSWPVQAIPYIGYFMMGNALGGKKVSKRGSYLSIGGGLLCLIGIYTFNQEAVYMNWQTLSLDPLAPCIVLASVLIYFGFQGRKEWKAGSILTGLAGMAFYIYLIHMLVIDPIYLLLFRVVKAVPNPLLFIPAFSVFVLLVSWCCSKAYVWIQEKMRQP